MVGVETIKCQKCGGQMGSKNVKKHNKIVVYFLIGLGILLSLTIIGAIVGVPLVILGLKMGSASDYCWVCEKCGTTIKKHG